jgi:hypothetical protein
MLVIIVGGIPIAMPTVLSVTLALGAYKLAKVSSRLRPPCSGAQHHSLCIIVHMPVLPHCFTHMSNASSVGAPRFQGVMLPLSPERCPD